MNRATRRSFKTTKREPITFDIDGEEFTCIPSLPGIYLIEFLGVMATEDNAKQASLVAELFKMIMEESEYERFMKYVRDPLHDVDLSTLVQIADFVTGEAAARPTEQSVPSATGPDTTLDTLTEASSPQE